MEFPLWLLSVSCDCETCEALFCCFSLTDVRVLIISLFLYVSSYCFKVGFIWRLGDAPTNLIKGGRQSAVVVAVMLRNESDAEEMRKAVIVSFVATALTYCTDFYCLCSGLAACDFCVI